ncbi:MAG: serine hydrolase, partial [Planctomycetales bacterium]|nr:serine hydrolase [Planctomycetales bacterium]
MVVALLVLTQSADTIHAQTTTAAQLQEVLEPLAIAHAGEVAVSVRVLDEANNVTCHWNYQGQRVMPTASLIKLPIMLEAYRQAAAGEVSLDDMLTLRTEDQVPGSGLLTAHFSPGLILSLRDAIRLMIRYSDNTATNLVVDHIGLPSTSST